MLVLLDLSSAFDIIDHHILAERMQSEFDITCTAKEWFASYLSDRTNRVCVLGDYSDVQVLKVWRSSGINRKPTDFHYLCSTCRQYHQAFSNRLSYLRR